MKSVVLGAGVVGVTTAYQLAKKGHQVTLIDKHFQVGLGCSHGNGGQLSYNFHHPIASPAIFKQLPKILLNLDPAFKIYPTLNVDFYKWGLRFLWQCLAKNSSHSSQVIIKLCQLAEPHLATTIKESNIEFDYRKRSGKVYVYPNQKNQLNAFNAENQTKLLTPNELQAILPELNKTSHDFFGILDNQEEVGDSSKFCRQLVEHMQQQYGVELLSKTTIRRINTTADKVTSVSTSNGEITADHFVLCLGAHSPELLKPIGINLPIYPMKGYSVTVPATDKCPDISITDTAHKTVYCRLGDRLRIASFAEFSDTTATIRPSRIKQLIANAKQFLPDAGDYDTILNTWCGLRPSTPDSIPVVEQSRYSNLFLNTGHGMLGWTQSSATAELVSNLILNIPQSFDMSLVSSARF